MKDYKPLTNEQLEQEQLFYIQCTEEFGREGSVLWWKPNSRGYTLELNEAGLYTKEQAESICKVRPPVERAIPREIAQAAAASKVHRRALEDAIKSCADTKQNSGDNSHGQS